MHSDLKTTSKVIGVKQTLRALRAGRARCVYLALDADPVLLAPVEELCRAQSVPLRRADTMAVLGQACGISVGAATVALLAESDSSALS